MAAGIRKVSLLYVSVVLGPEPWYVWAVHEPLIYPHDSLSKAMFFFVRLKMMQIEASITI